MIHYHGTPITPREQLLRMAGRHFCVSYVSPQDLKTCLQIGQSVMFDNGAYTVKTQGIEFDYEGFLKWVEPILAPPHFAVMPDVIDGTLEEQYVMRVKWPRETLGYDNVAPVWHLNEPISELLFLCNAYRKVCIGSSGEYWNIGTPKWCGRMDEAFNLLANHYGQIPWIHGLRMLGQTTGGWPLASADSTNVAQNHNRKGCSECMAETIDARQPSAKWKGREIQQEMFT